MINFIQNIMQLILAPSRGWEDLSYADHDCRQLVRRRLFPMFGIAALTKFVQMAYKPELEFDVALIMAVVIFVSLYVTYYFADMMFREYLDRFIDGVGDATKSCITISYTLCLLSMAITLCNVIPSSLGLPLLLPIAVALVFWKSSLYLKVKPDKDFAFECFGVLTIIVPPYAIQGIFDSLLK